MSNFASVSHDLVQCLELLYEPVGITFYKTEEELPKDIPFTQENLKSYCQALVKAGEGQKPLVKKDRMGCKLGTSVLGFEKDMEAFLDDGVLEKYGVGLFATEEASSETILKSTYLEKGQTLAALIAPLSTFEENPHAVLFTANSEQVMWLLYAANYDRGGKMDLPQSGGALGGCADITALPILKGVPNVTFLGLGCRIKSALDACHLMMGIPVNMIDSIHGHILAMEKPIGMLRKARTDS